MIKLSKADNLKVESVELEESLMWNESAWWVELKKGFAYCEPGCHCFAEDTKSDVRRSLKSVVSCDCDECKQGEAK